jgi:hypothetical protein
MTHIPFLFHQTLEQMRRVGARGGKAHAQFAWLRGAEKPGRQRRTGLPNSAQR